MFVVVVVLFGFVCVSFILWLVLLLLVVCLGEGGAVCLVFLIHKARGRQQLCRFVITVLSDPVSRQL